MAVAPLLLLALLRILSGCWRSTAGWSRCFPHSTTTSSLVIRVLLIVIAQVLVIELVRVAEFGILPVDAAVEE